MISHALGNRVRTLVAVVLTALLAVTGVVATGLPARAAAGDVANATLQWGLKESFRSYLVGPIAHGGWALSGGVTDSPAFSWSGGTGNYDAGAGTGSVGYPGSIRFTGHETPAGSGTFILDVTIADVRIAKTGATTAQLIVDGTSSGTSYPDAVFAEVNLTGATASTDGATVSYTAAPTTLTAAGSQIMQGFYPAGTVIDPVTFSWPVEQAVIPTPEYGNEAKWGISGYLNSANIGRPNPSPANYGAPATFDDASGISTWGEGTVVSNDDRTVSVSFEGSSVNHAKTGGGWIRIAELKAILDESGNGVVSGVVSYGTMAPPSVFNPATPPVRGPERVDLVTLSGNSAEIVVTPAGAAWSGLSGLWNEELLAFLAGDSAATPAVPAWDYASTVTNASTFTPDRRPSAFTFTFAEAPVFIGTPGGGPEDPDPTDPPVVVPPPATPGTLRWGVKSQFRDYVLGPIAHGSISTSGGAGASGSEFTFPQSASAIDAASGLGTASFRGSVQFTGHAGALSVLVGDPIVRITSPTSGVLSVATATGRVDFATLALGSATRAVDATGAISYAGIPATLTAAGASRFGGFYNPGDALAPVSFTVGANNPTNGSSTSVRSAAATPANTPDATPPATEGIELEGEPVEGGEFTATADGFQPNESGILVVIYSDPIVLADDATADVDGVVTWTGRLPAGLTGTHTLTFQGSVDRGIVLDIAAVEAVGCPVESATLTWGFKESFRSYITGLAAGEWTTAEGATYETPEFSWTETGGAWDGERSSGLDFAGAVRFTGHEGALDTTIANPRLVLDGDRGVLFLDVSGTTQDGRPITAQGIGFADLELAAAEHDADGDVVVISGISATLTAAGAAAFGTYEAGEALDPITVGIVGGGQCVQPVDAATTELANTDAVAASSPLGWWLLAGGVLLAMLIVALVLMLRRRWAVRAG